MAWFVYSQENQCGPIFHDQDGRENQSRDIENIPLNRLGFEPCTPSRAVIEGYRQLPVEDRQPSQQRLSTDGSAMMGGQIGQRRGERVVSWSVNLPQTGSEPLRVTDVAIEASGRPMAYAAVEPQTQEAFKDRWPRWSVAASMIGVSEWFAQQKTPSADTPTVIYGDPAGATSYAATAQKKPYWLLSAFAPNPK